MYATTLLTQHDGFNSNLSNILDLNPQASSHVPPTPATSHLCPLRSFPPSHPPTVLNYPPRPSSPSPHHSRRWDSRIVSQRLRSRRAKNKQDLFCSATQTSPHRNCREMPSHTVAGAESEVGEEVVGWKVGASGDGGSESDGVEGGVGEEEEEGEGKEGKEKVREERRFRDRSWWRRRGAQWCRGADREGKRRWACNEGYYLPNWWSAAVTINCLNGFEYPHPNHRSFSQITRSKYNLEFLSTWTSRISWKHARSVAIILSIYNLSRCVERRGERNVYFDRISFRQRILGWQVDRSKSALAWADSADRWYKMRFRARLLASHRSLQQFVSVKYEVVEGLIHHRANKIV